MGPADDSCELPHDICGCRTSKDVEVKDTSNRLPSNSVLLRYNIHAIAVEQQDSAGSPICTHRQCAGYF